MKRLPLLLLLPILVACSKKPDAPAPAAAPSTPTTPGPTTPPPPPVTNCQGATVLYSKIDQMPDNPVPNTKDFVIPNFEQSCGDTVSVYFRNLGVAPGTPWTTIHQGATSSGSYFTISNQTVTVVNSNGNTVDVDIEAVLK